MGSTHRSTAADRPNGIGRSLTITPRQSMGSPCLEAGRAASCRSGNLPSPGRRVGFENGLRSPPHRRADPSERPDTVEHMFALTDRDREHAAVLALTEASPVAWYQVADIIERAGSALALASGAYTLAEDEPQAIVARQLAERVTDDAIDRWQLTIEQTLASRPGTRLISVLDDEYPHNLRRVYNRPPFLFVRGTLSEQDSRSVAIVGTRSASAAGRALARSMAAALAERGVTVISGMAAGIDTEAHSAALDSGGRTIAVMGTGIDRIYPAENAALSERIRESGALLSQFWPGSPPRGSNFPLRNVVTSGVAVGTIVIEASRTSGAKMQARLALEHGKRLFLVESLVLQEEWAQQYRTRRGAHVVEGVDDIVAALESEREPVTELQLF
jgi:DNA processing protein